VTDSRMVIGSRGSPLALWQANWVRDQLASAGHRVEIRVIKTTGDRLQRFSAQQPLSGSIAQAVAEAGTKGLFIKEIEEALLSGEVDIAVHSLKDLPIEQPAALALAAVPLREDARDVIISKGGRGLEEIPPGSRVGTSSLRRQTQLCALRSDLVVMPLRGNLDTRLRKLDRGDCEALVVAAAGVHRLGLRERITAYFDFDKMCPAVGQGALAIEIRQGDPAVVPAVVALDHPPTHLAVRAERAVLRRLGGGCQAPIAAHAFTNNGQLQLWGVVASLDGRSVVRAQASGGAEDPESLGVSVAEELLKQGAQQILESISRP
jgi:hydroxymethylbilane synthase